MDRRELNRMFDQLAPEPARERELLNQLLRESARRKRPMKNWKRVVFAVAAAALLVTGAAAATAVVPGFGERLFAYFPAYTENQLYQIDEGHRTGSLSLEDTLFTFLEKFNSENMVDSITAKKENGFEYVVLFDDENSIHAIVTCTTPDSKLLVVMERRDYEETTGLWQVTAYQIIDGTVADEMIENNSKILYH